MKAFVCAASIPLLFGVAMPAKSQEGGSDAPPKVFQQVIECSLITDSASRLICFDGAVAALSEAQRTKAVLVVSGEEIRRERRRLFGLALPRIRLFGAGASDDETPDERDEKSELVSTIATVRDGKRGVVVTLPDGAVWEQTDNVYLGNVREGQTVVIRRAALDSYMAKINNRRAVRVKRIR